MKYGALEPHKHCKEKLSFCGFIAEELLDHNQTVATEFNLTLELGLQICSCRTIVQNVNAVNPPSRRRETLLKVKLLPGRLYGYMTPVYFHSVLLDCDGVSGSSSSPCYDLWNFVRQMSTRILWALETTPELHHLPWIVQTHQRTSWVPRTFGMSQYLTLALHPCHLWLIFAVRVPPYSSRGTSWSDGEPGFSQCRQLYGWAMESQNSVSTIFGTWVNTFVICSRDMKITSALISPRLAEIRTDLELM